MGTEISLNVGELSVSWSKNSMGIDHGMLFQEKNRIPVESDSEMKFSRKLNDIVPRLELLGFTLKTITNEYNKLAKSWKEEYQFLEENDKQVINVMSFNEFTSFIKTYPIKDLDNNYKDSKKRKKNIERFNYIPDIKCLPYEDFIKKDAYSELSYFEGLISFLHPYSLLRVLAECPYNLSEEVIWKYGPLVESGWATKKEFISNTRREQRFLIATEGSSDVHILKHAFSLLKPGIEDFFHFIDVRERHPFSGTGSLAKFAEGLIKIDILNNILFVFDNDAEGVEAYNKVMSLNVPSNIKVMVLPDLDCFLNFPAKGPEGLTKTNINGCAAAIECYLDLNIKDYSSARIIWTNYKEKSDKYQGSLEYKESYANAFYDQTREKILKGEYFVDNLVCVLESIVNHCCIIAEETCLENT